MKKILTEILKKIPLFIFCVLFVMGYNALFGTENTVMGITILTALLVFIKSDVGYKTPQAAISIGFCLILCGLLPYVATLNPFLGIPVNLLGIFFILVLSSYNVKMDCHIPFMLGYVFATGYKVDGMVLNMRMLSLLVGAVLLFILYLLVNFKKTYNVGIKDVFKSVSIHNPNTQWYIKLTVGLTVAMFIGDFFKIPNAWWIYFTVLSLTYHTDEVRTERFKHRLPATILGSVAFYLVFELLIPQQFHTAVVFLSGFIIMFISQYLHKTVGNSFNALASSLAYLSGGTAVLFRIGWNAVGIAFSYINHKLFDRLFKHMSKRDSGTKKKITPEKV